MKVGYVSLMTFAKRAPGAAAVALVLFVALSCSGSKPGLLGIEVPVGEGVVTAQSPYVVIGVYEGSPAYSAGLQPDDIILKIDGKDLHGLQYQYIYNNLLLGKPDTAVTLLVQRKDKQEQITIVRGRVAVKSK